MVLPNSLMMFFSVDRNLVGLQVESKHSRARGNLVALPPKPFSEGDCLWARMKKVGL